MSDELTREQFEQTLTWVCADDWLVTPERDEILAHDAAQRATIARLEADKVNACEAAELNRREREKLRDKYNAEAEATRQLEIRLEAADAALTCSIELDYYEAVNLLEALNAVLQSNGSEPLSALNSGDWIGQIAYKLQQWAERNPPRDFSSEPNRSVEAYRQEAMTRATADLRAEHEQLRAVLEQVHSWLTGGHKEKSLVDVARIVERALTLAPRKERRC